MENLTTLQTRETSNFIYTLHLIRIENDQYYAISRLNKISNTYWNPIIKRDAAQAYNWFDSI